MTEDEEKGQQEMLLDLTLKLKGPEKQGYYQAVNAERKGRVWYIGHILILLAELES